MYKLIYNYTIIIHIIIVNRPLLYYFNTFFNLIKTIVYWLMYILLKVKNRLLIFCGLNYRINTWQDYAQSQLQSLHYYVCIHYTSHNHSIDIT